jgi:hypothetical protein
VLVLALVGLLTWALNLNSDLDQQRQATAQAQQAADEADQQADQLYSARARSPAAETGRMPPRRSKPQRPE